MTISTQGRDWYKCRVVRPVRDVADADRVDVVVDGDDLLAVAHPADHVAQTVDFHLVKAQLLHLGLDAHDNVLFLAALAGMGDHIPQEPGHLRLVAFRRTLDRIEIHNAALHFK